MTYRWDGPTRRRDEIQVIECTCNVQSVPPPVNHVNVITMNSSLLKHSPFSARVISFGSERFVKKKKKKENKTCDRNEKIETKRFNSTILRHTTVSMHTSTLDKQHVLTSPRVFSVTLHQYRKTCTRWLYRNITRNQNTDRCATYTKYSTRGVTSDSVAKRRALLAAAGAGMIEGRFILWHASIVGIDLSTGEQTSAPPARILLKDTMQRHDTTRRETIRHHTIHDHPIANIFRRRITMIQRTRKSLNGI